MGRGVEGVEAWDVGSGVGGAAAPVDEAGVEGAAGGDDGGRVGGEGGEGRRGRRKVDGVLGRLVAEELGEEEAVGGRVVDGGFVAD